MSEQYDYDLFWHALNYRGAATQNAQDKWEALEACVNRLIAREREECATVCDSLEISSVYQTQRRLAHYAASAIRARDNV